MTTLPDFLIIGAQRCATGWISQCLREHPDIYMARDETRFFDRRYHKGLQWWQQRFFAGYAGEKAVGEKTANYLYEPDAARRIAQTLPHARLICCLRNPVTRMWSNYLMKFGKPRKADRPSFLHAVRTDPELVERGLYFKQLARFLDLFPRKQLLVTIYEDKTANPVAFIQNIYRFLRVDADYVPPSARIQTKPGALENNNFLLRFVARTLTSARLPFRSFYTRIRPAVSPMAVDEQTFRDLMKIFISDINKLADTINKDLSIWEKHC